MPNILLDLPRELRLCVYEYVFGDNNDEEIDFFAAMRYHPSTALLVTCKQICDEARSFHAAASELYRSTKTFTIMLEPKLIASDDLVQRIRRYEQSHIKLPMCVRNLRFGFLGSSASLLFSVDDNGNGLQLLERLGSIGEGASLQTWLTKGNIPTHLGELINSGDDIGRPYVLARGNNGIRMMQTGPIIAIVLSNCIHVRRRDDASRMKIMEAILDVTFSKGWYRWKKMEEEKKMERNKFVHVQESSLLRRANRVEKLQRFKNRRN